MSAVDAMQATLTAEHAAVWTYAVLGARTSQTAEATLSGTLTAGYVQHRAMRDQLVLMLRDLGADPVAAEPTYARPTTASAEERAAAAVTVEIACSQAYAWQVAHTTADQRVWASSALTWSAAQCVMLGAAPQLWPGAPELATTPATQ